MRSFACTQARVPDAQSPRRLCGKQPYKKYYSDIEWYAVRRTLDRRSQWSLGLHLTDRLRKAAAKALR